MGNELTINSIDMKREVDDDQFLQISLFSPGELGESTLIVELVCNELPIPLQISYDTQLVDNNCACE